VEGTRVANKRAFHLFHVHLFCFILWNKGVYKQTTGTRRQVFRAGGSRVSGRRPRRGWGVNFWTFAFKMVHFGAFWNALQHMWYESYDHENLLYAYVASMYWIYLHVLWMTHKETPRLWSRHFNWALLFIHSFTHFLTQTSGRCFYTCGKSPEDFAILVLPQQERRRHSADRKHNVPAATSASTVLQYCWNINAIRNWTLASLADWQPAAAD